MEEYINELNPNQREAVLYDDGPSLVVAGAGSGKTRVLTYKVAHLLQSGYQPHTLLALTFTNKAAKEMKHRISSLVDEYATRYLWIGTFHAVFYRILRREAQYIGYPPDFTIYDTADSKNLIKTILREMNLDDTVYRPNMIQSRISNVKNALITPNAYLAHKQWQEYDERNRTPLIGEIYKWYQNRCFNAGVMDFDELLLQTNILFRDHPAVLDKYQKQFRYVLVDEYQDTNFAQHLIVSRLSEKHKHIFVVGDDAQSIYSFRGANIDNMLRFQEQFPSCKVFKLEQNYRSTQNIVDAANSLIEKNKEQIRKTVFSKNEKGSKVAIQSAYSDYDEAYLVSTKIADMMKDKRTAYSDFAVLYRTNAQSRVLEDVFRKRLIAYKIYGGQSFYQRKEIKDIIAYLRVIVNPKDEESVKRIINYPIRGIGDTTVEKLQHAAMSAQVSLWEVVASPLTYQVDINKGTVGKIEHFRLMIEELRQKSKEMTVAEIGELTLKLSGLYNNYMSDHSIEGISRLENVKELVKAMAEFVTMRLEEGSNHVALSDFLMEVSLWTDQDNDNDKHESADKVTLMTVHAAKGLEFKNVIIVGMENDLFPSQQSMQNLRAIEEERRLFYVAITRAKENCIITYANSRFRNGKSNMATPSFFLNDIDSVYLNYLDDIELPNQYSSDIYDDQDESYGRTQRHKSSVKSPAWDFDGNYKHVKSSAWDSDDNYKSASYYSQMKKTNTESKGRINRMSPTLKSVEKPMNRYTPIHSDEKDTNEPTGKIKSAGGFTVGNKVLHERFGEGIVIELAGKENDAQATVDFKNAGKKNLLLKFAKLKIISNG